MFNPSNSMNWMLYKYPDHQILFMPYYVYVILCRDNTFYTGYTKDIDSRMKLHMNGKAARYTRTHKPKKLVYVQEYSSRAEAMRNERKTKRLSHCQKLELINAHTKNGNGKGY
jgi:putative endonuclease